MNNFIELNMKQSHTSLNEVDNTSHLKVLKSNFRLFPDEKIDMPTKRFICIDCGTRENVAINGYCDICNNINNHLNY